ncbi:MAG: hypothetical protein M1482_01725 [Chloroflexi bacterium]|nr:hypothetical protein [Chloroflexota bacterium]
MLALCLVLLFLLASAKISTVYWPLIGMGFVFYLFKPGGGKLAFAVLAAFALVLFFGAIWITKPDDSLLKYNAVDRFFNGALTFSDAATARLTELGIPESARCVDVYSQTPEGKRCVREYGKQATFQNLSELVLKEPVIILRMAFASAENAQQVSVRWGKRAIDAEVGTVPQQLNLWGLIRGDVFPKGLALLGLLTAYAALFAYNIRAAGLVRGLSIVGLVSAIGSLVDMQAAIWGAGKGDLARHLFLANALFDFATICAFNLLVVYVVYWARRKSAVAADARRLATATNS